MGLIRFPENIVASEDTQFADEVQLFFNGDDCDRFYEDDYSQVIDYAE